MWIKEKGQDAWAVADNSSSGLGQWLAVAAEPIGGGNLVSFLKVPNVLINDTWKVLPFMYDVHKRNSIMSNCSFIITQ
jgi:hypothetical protein